MHRAHTTASTNVLRMLVTHHRLVDRLRSLRLYFFVAHGDWLVNLLDAARTLLVRPASEVKSYQLNLLLQSSIAKSSCRDDPCHGFTRCSLSDETLARSIELTRQRDPTFTNVYRGHQAGAGGSTASATKGSSSGASRTGGSGSGAPSFELLQLEVASEWPLSLILNDIFLTKLNFAFRLILRCKVCERALHAVVWQHQQQHQRQQSSVATAASRAAAAAAAASRSNSGTSTSTTATTTGASANANTGNSGLAVSLRSQLLQFVRQFQFFAAHEVLEPAWKAFIAKVEMAPGINHIGSASSELCAVVLRGLALSSEHGSRILSAILDMALDFATVMNNFNSMNVLLAGNPLGDSSSSGIQHGAPLSPEQLHEQLARWQTELYRLLTDLADPTHPDSSNMQQMLVWLDFNGFYEKLGVYRVRHAATRHDRSE